MTLVQVIPTRSRRSEEGLKAKCRCEWRGWISHCIVTTLRAPSVVSDIGVGWCWSSRWHRSPGDRPGGVGPKHWGHTGPILMSDVPRDLGVRCIPYVLRARRAPPCSENQGGAPRVVEDLGRCRAGPLSSHFGEGDPFHRARAGR
jgi:hypothetical protein